MRDQYVRSAQSIVAQGMWALSQSGLLKAVFVKGTSYLSRIPLFNIWITHWVEVIGGWESFCLAHLFYIYMCVKWMVIMILLRRGHLKIKEMH